jgi:hypothetical protein
MNAAIFEQAPIKGLQPAVHHEQQEEYEKQYSG